MSETPDINMTGTDPPPQSSITEDTEPVANTPRKNLAQRTPNKATPDSALRIRLKPQERPQPPPKAKEPHSGTPFGLKRIGLPNGGFYIPSQIFHTKDFIDTTYYHAAGPVSLLLHTELTTFLSHSSYPIDTPILPNPHAHHPAPYTVTFPRWRQNSTCGAHLPTWPSIKSFLRQFRPCIDAAGEAFKKFRPGEHAHMMLYHDHLIRAYPVASNPGLRKPVWEDGYRTPFAKMRVSVNVERGVRRLEEGFNGGMWFQGSWKVVVLLGNWVGGRVIWTAEGGEVFGFEEAEEGDVWVLGGETLIGNEGFVGQRIQVELFVPEVGYMGDDGDGGNRKVTETE
ncbi:hypothetical protein DL98DRAFT_573152 [Cadophora sp. DSE1049]|nr:hypothetical protein DL98DRAFT_573152 [Cadophora sp. DSE1049]